MCVDTHGDNLIHGRYAVCEFCAMLLLYNALSKYQEQQWEEKKALSITLWIMYVAGIEMVDHTHFSILLIVFRSAHNGFFSSLLSIPSAYGMTCARYIKCRMRSLKWQSNRLIIAVNLLFFSDLAPFGNDLANWLGLYLMCSCTIHYRHTCIHVQSIIDTFSNMLNENRPNKATSNCHFIGDFMGFHHFVRIHLNEHVLYDVYVNSVLSV